MSRTFPRNNEWLQLFSSYFALDIFRNFLRIRKFFSEFFSREIQTSHCSTLFSLNTKDESIVHPLCCSKVKQSKFGFKHYIFFLLSLSLPYYKLILLERKEIEFYELFSISCFRTGLSIINAISNIFLTFLEKLCRYFGIDSGTAWKNVNSRGDAP